MPAGKFTAARVDRAKKSPAAPGFFVERKTDRV